LLSCRGSGLKAPRETEERYETPGRISPESGGSIVVEIDEPETGGTVCVVREDKIEKARESFEDTLNKVLPVTKTVVEKLRGMASKPEEIEVTFGVNLSTMAGAVIASASAAVNFGVTVRWTGTHKETTP
jgi:NTP-dependent ternary system trypsin peptidase co-occuring protein